MTVVGSAQITVTAVTNQFKRQIQQAFREARPVATQEGDRFGKQFGDRFSQQFKRSFQSSFRDLRTFVRNEGDRQGTDFGRRFGTGFRREITAAAGDAFRTIQSNAQRFGRDSGQSFGTEFRQAVVDTGRIGTADILDIEDFRDGIGEASDAAGEAGAEASQAFDDELDISRTGQRAGEEFREQVIATGRIQPEDLFDFNLDEPAEAAGRAFGQTFRDAVRETGRLTRDDVLDVDFSDLGRESGQDFGGGLKDTGRLTTEDVLDVDFSDAGREAGTEFRDTVRGTGRLTAEDVFDLDFADLGRSFGDAFGSAFREASSDEGRIQAENIFDLEFANVGREAGNAFKQAFREAVRTQGQVEADDVLSDLDFDDLGRRAGEAFRGAVAQTGQVQADDLVDADGVESTSREFGRQSGTAFGETFRESAIAAGAIEPGDFISLDFNDIGRRAGQQFSDTFKDAIRVEEEDVFDLDFGDTGRDAGNSFKQAVTSAGKIESDDVLDVNFRAAGRDAGESFRDGIAETSQVRTDDVLEDIDFTDLGRNAGQDFGEAYRESVTRSGQVDTEDLLAIDFEDIGRDAGRSFVSSFRDAVADDDGLQIEDVIDIDFDEVGERFGRAFGEAFKDAVIETGTVVPDDVFDYDAFEQASVTGGQDSGNAFGSSFKDAAVDSGRITEEDLLDLGQLSAEAQRVGNEAGSAAADGFRQGVEASGPVEADDLVDTAGFDAELDRTADSARSAGRRAADAFEDELDFDGIGGRAGRQFTAGLTGPFQSAARRAADAFTVLYAAGNILGSILGVIVSGLASLVTGLFAVTAAAIQAANALVVLPSLLGALVQAASTIGFAFRGVGAAISAGFDQSAASIGGGTTQIVNSTRRVADARENLSRVYEDNARRIRDANYRVRDAEEALSDAQEDARRAQQLLTSARERAAENLQQLGFDVEDAALSEERAVLRLQQATEELARVRANPASTAQELQEASLRYREAELNLRIAQDRLEDLEEAEREAAAAGVEGSEEVVRAKEDIREANDRVADAEENLRRAEEARSDVIADNARRVADAQQRVTEAIEDQGRAISGGAAAVDKYREALDKLSPQAREFVEYIVSLQDEFEALRDAAGEELFPKLIQALQPIVTNFFPALQVVLRETGSALGDVALSISEVVSSEGFIRRFTTVAQDNVETIRRFGEFAAASLDGLSGVLVAAGPLVDRFTGFLVEQAETFQEYATSAEGIAEIEQVFNKAGDVAAQLGRIIRNVYVAFRDLGREAEPAGQYLLDTLEEVTEAWEDWIASTGETGELEDFFQQSAENAAEILGLFTDLGKEFLKLGSNPGIEDTARKLREEWVPALGEIFDKLTDTGSAFADLLISVTDVTNAFLETGAIKVFFGVLEDVVDLVDDFIRSDLGQFLLNTVGPIVAVAKAFDIAQKTAGFFFKVIAGSFDKFAQLGGKFDDFQSKNIRGLSGAFRDLTRVSETTAGRIDTAVGKIFGRYTKEFTALDGSIRTATAYTSRFGDTFARPVTRGLSAVTGAAAAAGRGIARAGSALLGFVGGPVGAAFIVLTAIIGKFISAQQEAKQRVEDLTESLDEQTGALTAQTFTRLAEEIGDDLNPVLEDAGLTLEDFLVAVAQGEQGLNNLASAVQSNVDDSIEANALYGILKTRFEELRGPLDEAASAYERKNAAEAAGAAAAEQAADAAVVGGDAFSIYTEEAEGAAGALDGYSENAEDSADATAELLDELEKLVDEFGNLNDDAVDLEKANQRVAEGFEEFADNVLGSVDALRDERDAVDETTAAGQERIAVLDELIAAEQEGAKQLDINTQAGRDARNAILEQIEALDEQRRANILSGDSVEEAQKKYEKQREELRRQVGQLDLNVEAVDGYITEIEKTPEEVETEFYALTNEQAVARVQEELNALKFDKNGKPRDPKYLPEADRQKIRELEAQLAALEANRKVNYDVEATARLTFDDSKLPKGWRYIRSEGIIVTATGGRIPLAEGGPVVGPGGPKSDKIPAWLSNGEFVLSAKAVAQLGGAKVVNALHKSLKQGLAPPHLQTGGTVSATTGGVLSLLAEGGRSERVEPLDSRGLSEGDKAILRALEEGSGFQVTIGQIVTEQPQEAAREVVSAMRAESYRMGQTRT